MTRAPTPTPLSSLAIPVGGDPPAGDAGAPAWRGAWRRLVRHRTAAVGALVLLAFAVVAIAGRAIEPYDPNHQPDIIAQQHLPPSGAHWFGTDNYSRDVLSRVLDGARVSLRVGFLAVVVAALVGTAWGAVAGFAGGWTDIVLMRLVDAFFAIPRVLLLVLVAALWHPLPLDALILVLGLTGWFSVSRLVRTEVRAIQQREFVSAARALGVPRARILLRHVLPHVLAPVLVTATIGVSNAIIMEAGLSFLGLGVAPPQASWGSIIHDGYPFIDTAWWVSIFPGLALVTTVLSVNALADGLREALNPRQLPAP